MDTIIDQQVAMDEALVPHTQRLGIGRSNFHLLSNIKSKESTLQLVYDVLRLCPFFKALLVIADVPEIYMQEFWATATVHHHAIRFKMDNKKHIVNLESFRDMLHICPRVHGQSFAEPPFKEEILAFIRPRLTTSQKGKQAAKASKAKSLSALSEVSMTEAQQLKLVTKRSDDEGKDGDGDEEDDGDDGEEGNGDNDDEDDDGKEGDDDDQEVVRDDAKDDEKDDEEEGGDDEQEYDEKEYDEETKDEESFDPIPKTPKNNDDEGNGEEDLGFNIGREEGHDEEEEEDELYRDVNINQGRDIQATLEVEDSHVTLTPSSSVSSQFVTSMLNPTLDVGMESIFETTSQMDAHTPISVAPLPMTAPTMTPSTISTITTTSQASILPTTAPGTIIQNLPNFSLLFGFDNRLRTLEANFSEFMQTNQFAKAVSAILGIVQRYMDQRMNEAVKVAIQIQSDRLCDEAQRENDEFLKTVDENMQKIIKEQVKEQVKTSYAVAADLSKMELKKILIEKMEGNKSIQCSDEQRNLYKALVDAYESDKIILDTYIETVTLKRRRDDDADKDEKPSAGPDRGSKRRREGKEPEPASALTETATRSVGRSTQGSKSRQASSSKSAFVEEPMHTTFQIEEPSHPKFDTSAEDQPIVQSSQHPEWFSQQQKPPSSNRDWNKTVDTLTLKLLAGPTYELMKGLCKSLVEHKYHLEEVFKATTDQLDWVNPEGQQYPHNMFKPLPLIPNNRGRCVIPFEHFINNDLEYLRGGTSSRKYTTSITKTKAANYGHIKWIEDLVPRTMWIEEPICYDKDDDKLYKFKEGNFKRLRIQDIEDMLLLLVHGKLTNLTVEERFAFNVSLRMFTRSIVIPRRVEDLQLGNKDKKNRLMQIDELHKFSDGTLIDVCIDRLKGIRMQYLPQSIWRKSDKDRAAAMIQAIDKRLKTRRIMRSLERFVGGRLYEGDIRMLQRTI
nr:hypothetical protein [Tanacetum cinerariifolium]